jgi:hypothetical protein
VTDDERHQLQSLAHSSPTAGFVARRLRVAPARVGNGGSASSRTWALWIGLARNLLRAMEIVPQPMM